MNAFNSQDEIQQMLDYSFNKFQNELQLENTLKKKKEEQSLSH